jgi:hypothetical protein
MSIVTSHQPQKKTSNFLVSGGFPGTCKYNSLAKNGFHFIFHKDFDTHLPTGIRMMKWLQVHYRICCDDSFMLRPVQNCETNEKLQSQICVKGG